VSPKTACRRKSGEAVPEPFAEMIAHDAISRPDQSERKAPLAPGAALIRAGREPLPEAVGLITHRDATRDIAARPIRAQGSPGPRSRADCDRAFVARALVGDLVGGFLISFGRLSAPYLKLPGFS
jgi:hypothetical protein